MNCHSENMHLGDAMWTLTAMSRLRGPHTLCCNPVYHDQLRELVMGTDITIKDLSRIPVDSMDCWIASGLFESQGIRYENQTDIMGFVQRYFNAMGESVNLGRPFERREDMLCEWPTILSMTTPQAFTGILVVNADPKSGQCPEYSSSQMDELILKLENEGHSVCAIEKAELTLAQIGSLAMRAKIIIGCATGPMWPTFSLATKSTQRYVLLHPMKLDFGSVPIKHSKNASELAWQLIEDGIL